MRRRRDAADATCCDTRAVKPILVAPVVLAALLAGCSSSGTPADAGVRDTSRDVAFTDCADACAGELNGAQYRILLPDTWNGTLLLYSHGYRSATPRPPDYTPVTTEAEPAPGWSQDETRLADALLDQGYALAGSGWASNGWAVADGVRAADDLYRLFRDSVAVPKRVYVWGDSLGGLVTEEIAEQHPEWVDGAAPLCGAHAGVVPNMDLALDLAVGVRALIDPTFVTHGYTSADQANKEWTNAAAAVVAAAQDVSGGGTADVLALGALVDAAPQTKTFDAATPESRVKAAVEAVLTGLGFSTSARYEAEQRFGGSVSDNTATDYAARFSAEDRSLLDNVGGPGSSERIIAALQAAERVSADPAAVQRAEQDGGDPSGAITVPTITLHTAADPLVLVQNQSFLNERYQANPDKTADLVQLFTVAPATFSESTGAPYGAGHCNFTPESRIGVITLLDGWIRDGVYPAVGRVQQVLGTNSGYSPVFRPGPWPAED